MEQPAGFTITETLGEDETLALHRGVRDGDGRRVVIKTLGPARRGPRDLERLRNEYDIGRRLHTRWVVRPLSLELHRGPPTLVLEDFPGDSLERNAGGGMELERFLRLAIGLAGALAELHDEGVVHGDVKPANVLVHPESGAVKLTGLASASLVASEHQTQTAASQHLVESSLPYMSPEQTGRTNLAVDSRSDLYSLGITLFEVRAGRLPFRADDPLGWIYCHLARPPPRLADVAPGTPEVLSSILDKLLAKAPEDRYQTARGVRHDLQRCLDQHLREGRVEPFPLGARDASDRFQIPQRLYGRDEELATLLGAFERVVQRGTPELVLVSGYAGIGKTALVRELSRPIVRERGFFLSGKFDQFQRGTPYSTISRAFGGLVLELLAEGEERVAAWRRRLREALGVNAQLIIDVIPEVELLVGKQPPAAELPVEGAERRFRIVFRQFLRAFSSHEHPLVLFLDDMQWAEAASLALVRDVLTHAETRHLLLLCAYRDNEVGPFHPLMSTVDALRSEGVVARDLAVRPLTREHVLSIVSESVRRPPSESVALADLVHEKTGGNPFFAIQFLTSLHEDHLLRFDPERLAWRWDLEEIRARGFTDNVVDLMVARLRKLPRAARNVLELAACVGHTFDAATLAMLCGRSEEETSGDLWPAVQGGLVFRSDHSYRFLHDRVQQAAHSLIPERRRSGVHLRIGRLLLAHTPEEQLHDRVFDIVNQLNLGVPSIDDPSERERLVELNLMAGRRAKAAAAFGPAAGYLAAGAGLLSDDAWSRSHESTFALHVERAQCAYANKTFEDAGAFVALLLRHARDRVELAAAYIIGIRLRTALGEVEGAILMSLEFLRRFGIDLPLHPTEEQFAAEYGRVLAALGDRPIESLVELPSSDRETSALLDVLTTTLSAAYFYDQRLWALVVFHGVRTSIEKGNADSSAISYQGFGMVLGAVFGRYLEGHRFAKVTLALLDRRKLVAYKAEIELICGFCLASWVEPLGDVISYLDAAFQAGQETGDLLFACYACTGLVALLLAKGESLDEVRREAKKRLEFARWARVPRMADSISSSLLFVQKLTGHGELDEGALERRITEATSAPMELCWHFVRKLQWSFLLGDYGGAAAAVERAKPLLWATAVMPQLADFVFFHALLLARTGAPASAIVPYEQKLRLWAEGCPATFRARAELVSAELARLEARDHDAALAYERAIDAARGAGFVHDAALACELAGEFHRGHGLELAARAYLREARDAYLRWGADAKVTDLDRRYPEVAPGPEEARARSFALRAAELDVLSVIKASHTISREIMLDELARTLVRVVMEHGGAQRGFLVVARDGQLTVEAAAELGDEGLRVELLPSPPVGSSGLLPESVVQYAARTRRSVLLADATVDARPFEKDAYFARRRPRSVLCMPILRRGQPTGFVYLENTLVAGAFTADRLLVLGLLASQAAISLENAQLLARELLARQSAEEAERRAAFLAEAGAILSESLELEQVLSRLAELTARSVADWCQLDLLEGENVRRVAGAHANPAKAALLARLASRYPPTRESPRLSARVLRTGEPLLVERVTDDVLRSACADAEHERLLRELGFDTVMVVPLRSRGLLGVMTLASAARAHPYGPADLRLAEELARRAAMAIDNARLFRQTREGVKLRDDFLRVASHELSTPVTAMQIALQSLLTHSAEPGFDAAIAGRFLRVAERQARRLGGLVGELLDVSRADAKALSLDLVEVELGALVRDVVAQLELELRRARCPIHVDAPGPVRARCDRGRIEQVLKHLLANALKFGAGKPLELAVGSSGSRARVSVRDHGMGIDPAMKEHVFERFARGVSAEHYGGLGLGLYLSSRIVEAHGGTIAVESEPGAGSTFTVELPLAPWLKEPEAGSAP